MNFDAVKVTPNIPKRISHPNIVVYGRGDEQFESGEMVYVEAENGHPAGYTFSPNGNYISPKTLRQISDKIHEANRAVEAGLL